MSCTLRHVISQVAINNWMDWIKLNLLYLFWLRTDPNMNKLYNCSLRRKPAKGGRLLVSFHDFTHSGKNYLREIKEFKEARQSASSVGRTTPQPVSEIPFLILVQKKSRSVRNFILYRYLWGTLSKPPVWHKKISHYRQTVYGLLSVIKKISAEYRYKQSECDTSNHATHYSELTYDQAVFLRCLFSCQVDECHV